jgi:hypothetical protein
LGLQETALSFYLENPSLTVQTFHDMVYRAGSKVFDLANSDKPDGEQLRHKLVSFYRSMYLAADKLPNGLDHEPSLGAWTDQFTYLLRKENLRTESELVCNRLLESIRDAVARKRTPNIFLLGLCYELDRYADCVEDPKLFRSLDLSLHEGILKDNGALSGGTAGMSASNCKRYLRSVERFRRCAGAALATVAKPALGKDALQLKLNVLATLRSCGPVLELLSKEAAPGAVDFGPHLFELHLFLTRLLTMLESERDGAQIDPRQLDKARELAREHATAEQLHAMANVFYVQGTAAYKDERYADASKAMEESCGLVKEAIDVAEQKNAGSSSSEHLVTLAKRREMLATCLHLDGRKTVSS